MTVTQGTILKTICLFMVVAVVAGCGGRPDAKADDRGDDSENRLARVAAGLQQPLVIEGQEVERWAIEDRMRRFAVPAVSAAVIDDGRLAAAGAWGAIVAGSDEPVTTETMFQAGSISKPVTALLALALVNDGTLQLDLPINDVLHSWKVPDNDFTSAVPVTLRHVMSHQAGFTPFGYLVPRSAPSMPGMAELLRGEPYDWPAVTVEFEPGSRHAYSNSGYCVLQLVLEDASNRSLHELAVQRMFDRLGMDHSTFDEPLEPALLIAAASGHTRGPAVEGSPREPVPVEGKAEIAPAATGGLWSTPSDLARLAVEVLRARRGESELLIPRELAEEFLTRQVASEGLGIHLEGEGPTLSARHGGGMVGFVAHLVFYPNVGKGAVVMSNSDGGRWVNRELIAAIAHEYGWPGFPVRRSLGTVTAEQIGELVGVYVLDAAPTNTFSVSLEDGRAVGQINQYPPFAMTPTTEPDLFVLARESLEIEFGRGQDGTVTRVTLRRSGDTGNRYTRRPSQ
jgi:CubicO group peptidase (beta-lactamase class C family)